MIFKAKIGKIGPIARSAPPATLCVALRAGNGRHTMFYTYVLQSEKDGEIYIGWSNNLKKRLVEHNKGLVFATKAKRPLTLIYYEACLSEKLAIAREKQLKSGFGRAYLKRRLKI